MLLKKLKLLKQNQERYYLIYILSISIITIVLIILRILFYFFKEELSGLFFFDLLIKNRDLNFKTNYNLMYNGLIHYYEGNILINENAIYLYFWYFIFYPFYNIPLNVSMYVWDILRFISTIYIAINIKRISQNRRELLYFFLLSGVGYFSDMYLNNTNWLIQLLLFNSYIQLKKGNKLFSGILFSISTFKIILILFPLILLIVKRIKLADLIYYYLPFVIINIPYMIFPEYFLQMISNWFQSVSLSFSLISLFLNIWRLIQPAQLMYISIIILIIIENIKNKEKKNKISFLIYTIVFILWILIWISILEIAFFL